MNIRIFFHRAILPLLTALFAAVSCAHAEDDPPARVARLNYIDGNASYASATANEWEEVHVNRPLITGDRLWVPQAARAELHIGSNAVHLDAQTSLEFTRLSDRAIQLRLAQGSLNLRVRRLADNEAFEIDTPNLAFVIQQPGSYRFTVDTGGDATAVTIWQGGGVAYGGSESLALNGRRQVQFSGTQLILSSATSQPTVDMFDTWAFSRDQNEDASISARYVSRDYIGYEQLDAYGTWQQNPVYGPVWVPNVVYVGWAPYRSGHWSWIPPWGWTWIDDAPWGFAPYHYGRWTYLGNRWCWVPGAHAVRTVPVYAPALVAFVANGRSAASGVAWVPLGPGEVFRPAYSASHRYFSRMNQNVAVNNSVTNHAGKPGYVNQSAPHAMTAVPVFAFKHDHAGVPATHALKPPANVPATGSPAAGRVFPVAPETQVRVTPHAPIAMPLTKPASAPIPPQGAMMPGPVHTAGAAPHEHEHRHREQAHGQENHPSNMAHHDHREGFSHQHMGP